MPFTEPLADLPVTWPSAASKPVNPDGTYSPELLRLLAQIREYLTKADSALRDVEP